jgi:serine/threonine protein kinase
MGEVYRAHDPKLGRDVALKILPRELAHDPDRRARMLREARAAASLNHPGICTIHDVGEADVQMYIAMEVIDGQSLSARLIEGPLPFEEVVRIALQLADAVAHERGNPQRRAAAASGTRAGATGSGHRPLPRQSARTTLSAGGRSGSRPRRFQATLRLMNFPQ